MIENKDRESKETELLRQKGTIYFEQLPTNRNRTLNLFQKTDQIAIFNFSEFD